MMFLSFAALLRCRSLVRSLLSWSSPVVVQVDALTAAWLSSPRGCRWCSRCCCGRGPDRWGRAITAAVGRRILAPRPKWAGVLTATMQRSGCDHYVLIPCRLGISWE